MNLTRNVPGSLRMLDAGSDRAARVVISADGLSGGSSRRLEMHAESSRRCNPQINEGGSTTLARLSPVRTCEAGAAWNGKIGCLSDGSPIPIRAS